MSLRRVDKHRIENETLDGLIRWALRDSVADAEPSAQVWEHIQRRVLGEAAAAKAAAPAWREVWLRRFPSLNLAVRHLQCLSRVDSQRMDLMRILAAERITMSGFSLRYC